MQKNTIDANVLKKMFISGTLNLESKKEWINELNVFPVPDGDTGTNMTLTMKSAVKEISSLDNPSMESLAKAISFGSLIGARGNSGVILSQLLRGFTKVIMESEEINDIILANACQRGVETAYKAVMKPKEGTILTVAKAVSDKINEAIQSTRDLSEILKQAIEYGDYMLEQTPEMLPVLKEAGVVDSGGQGLMEFIKGAYDAFLGKEVDYSVQFEAETKTAITPQTINLADIKFAYCTEFIIMLEKDYGLNEETEFKSYLESMGDSIVAISDDGIVKAHIHTNDPGLAIQKALSYGSLTNIKIDNMREEHKETLIGMSEKNLEKTSPSQNENKEMKEVGFIAVSAGEGLHDILSNLGVDYIIEGGQTMNPSTQDILNAVDKVNAKTVFVLPNNSNIILAANQAEKLSQDKTLIVIPTKTVTQGITVLINYSHDETVEENFEKMNSELSNIKTAQITYAVRDTVLNDIKIKENDIMGIDDNGIVAVGSEIMDTAINTVKKMIDDESAIISIYYGQGVTEEEAEEFVAKAEELFPDLDVELNWGGQPIYYYIISVE